MDSLSVYGSEKELSKLKKKKKSKKVGKSKAAREVLVHGSLPPQVEGHIRCFVVVRLNKPSWKIGKPPENVFLRSMWWGETAESAAIFSPSENKILARYPVRSGPKQMASYLTDAGTLHIDVLRGADMSVIGKIQVYGLSSLASGKSLVGPYPIFSSKSEIIGHVDVKVSMQALHMFEDSGSSAMPTTDLDNTEQSELRVSREKINPKLGTPSAFSSLISHPQGTSSTENVDKLTELNSKSELERSAPTDKPPMSESDDLISNLIQKGQRLRSAMISSTIDSAPSNIKAGAEASLPSIPLASDHREYLEAVKQSQRSGRRPHPDLKSVDLVLGSPVKKAVYLSDSGSISSIYEELSDPEDPAHDQEILDLLFYRKSTAQCFSAEKTEGVDKTLCQQTISCQQAPDVKKRVEEPEQDSQVPRAEAASVCSSVCDQPGNVRPPSRCSTASPRVCLSPAPFLTGNQSDSGGSRVSFDMTASDDEDTRSAAEGLSVEQLTLLARVSVARVHIDKLNLKDRPSTPVEKKTYKGRPPPVKTSKYGTYFVEYQFPVVAASRDQTERNTTATETVRAVSKKVEKSGGVTWNHHTVFPVYFDGNSIEKWWNSMLVLKIHHREPSSRTATLIGSCSLQMKQLLQSLTFGLDLALPVAKHQKRGSVSRKRRRRRADIIGELKLNIQLDSDSPSFATALRELQINKARKQHPLLKPKPETPLAVPNKPEHVRPAVEPLKVNIQHRVGGETGRQVIADDGQANTSLMLHMLLQVTGGRQLCSAAQSQGISAGSMLSSYAVCRIFWSGDKLQSETCWSTSTPDYRINESIPLHLTKDILSNMCNNYMVVEVWEKRSMNKKDQLLGYAKLPLNTFYMSYKEPRIASVLMKSQYPVIAVDSYLPVTNPLTGRCMGEVKALLAMGTQEQVMSLQTLKVVALATQPDDRLPSHNTPQKHPADRLLHVRPEKEGQLLDADSQEHRFDVKIVAVRDLDLGDAIYQGEADCYVQYHFPTQHNVSDDLIMKVYRSPTTLCTTNVTFDDHRSYLITLSQESNLQRLVSAVVGVTHGTALPFELWCRFYYPNTRDQLMFRGLFPVAKLLGLITMNSGSDTVSCQSYSLPLTPVGYDNTQQLHSAGVLDISIRHTKKVHYQSASQQHVGPSYGLHNLGEVTLSVCINSVTGLQSAAMALAKKHQCLDYYSTVGVNFYVKLMLSFQSKSEVRVSDTEPRVFYLEEFGFRSHFPLPLLIDNNTSLAQCLNSGYLIAEVWHQSLKDPVLDDCPGIPPSSDIQLGVVSVPLANLLTHKTGIRGWYPVNPPPELYTITQSQDPMLGALNIQARLSGSQDISSVVEAASKMGYQVDRAGVDATDVVIDELTEVDFEIDWFSIPASLVLKSEYDDLPIDSVCYLKTSFYNNDVAYSTALRLTDKGDNFECRCNVRFKYLQTVSTSFLWYLFDQNLELELWLCTQRDSLSEEITPSSSDRYLGTAYIPLEHLCKHRACALSDVYPLYKPCTKRMGRSLLQAHVSRRPQKDPQHHQQMQVQRVIATDEAPAPQLEDLNTSDQSEEGSLDENTIETMISIEEANRLTIGLSPGTRLHVTYSLAGKEHMTPGVEATNRPCWMYEKCVRFHLPSIHQSKHLVMKLWSKCEEKGSQVIGFTTIDLRPLLAGMSYLSGWYNIVDFTGLCQGQIKCGIQPLTSFKSGQRSYETSPAQNPQIPRERVRRGSPTRYSTAASYTEYPSHVAKYTEQQVQYGGSTHSSSSTQLLRKQLAELDVITNNLRKKLYQPNPPPSSDSVVVEACLGSTAVSSAASSSGSSQVTRGRLMETVAKAHDNVLELVKHGVVQADEIISPKSTLPVSMAAPVSQSGSEYMGKAGDSAAPLKLETVESEDEFPSTPRTQAIFNMSSDEEHFSPPVYVKAKPGNIESKRRSISVSSAEWLSDGVKPLASDTTQDTPLHSPSQGLALNPADIQAAEVFPTSSDHVTERLSLSSQSDQLKCEVNRERRMELPNKESSSDYPGTSKGVLLDGAVTLGGEKLMSGSQQETVLGGRQERKLSIKTNTPSESKTDGKQKVLDAKQEMASADEEEVMSKGEQDVKSEEKQELSFKDEQEVMSDEEQEVMSEEDQEVMSEEDQDVMSEEEQEVMSEEEQEMVSEEEDYEEEEAVSRVINEEDETDLPFGTFHDSTLEVTADQETKLTKLSHGQLTDLTEEEGVLSVVPDSPHLESSPHSNSGDEKEADVEMPPAEIPQLTGKIPSFFPSKEELAAKMAAARESHSQQTEGKFIQRKSVAQILREQNDISVRAKTVANIFATRFSK